MADIEVVKCTDKLAVVSGEIIRFTIIIKNTGDNEGENLVLTDALPTEMSFMQTTFTVNGVSDVSADPNAGVNLGTIGVDDIITATFYVMIYSSTTPVEIVNNATLDFEISGVPDTVTSNDVTILVKNDLTDSETLYYYAIALQEFAGDFCNNVIPTIIDLISTDINKVVDILGLELCSCKNNEDLISKGVCNIAKKTLEDDDKGC